MMELIWDDELAVIARRWALQCKLFEKDQCRDVERFGVWQNVNVLDMDSVKNGTSSKERIHFHITSWYDEVEDFDNAEVGFELRVNEESSRPEAVCRAVHLHLVQIIIPFRLVNYSNAALSSYIPLASATFIYVGCGRAIYTLNLIKTTTTPGGDRVEVLVCNYGPVDRTAPQQLYKLGRPGLCPLGTLPSDRYQSLCSKCKP
ncbi:venom allergen 3-like [Pogonomyrmex barbatus]|uniref:Venom allergen 3-like n=1 Tax=Pogonomyrmex barbatus TaxID=144034 RepID=A0A8N1S9I3_9HYME|nr:venom allergen 3-like [Pogonomyrmex barbatus]